MMLVNDVNALWQDSENKGWFDSLIGISLGGFCHRHEIAYQQTLSVGSMDDFRHKDRLLREDRKIAERSQKAAKNPCLDDKFGSVLGMSIQER